MSIIIYFLIALFIALAIVLILFLNRKNKKGLFGKINSLFVLLFKEKRIQNIVLPKLKKDAKFKEKFSQGLDKDEKITAKKQKYKNKSKQVKEKKEEPMAKKSNKNRKKTKSKKNKSKSKKTKEKTNKENQDKQEKNKKKEKKKPKYYYEKIGGITITSENVIEIVQDEDLIEIIKGFEDKEFIKKMLEKNIFKNVKTIGELEDLIKQEFLQLLENKAISLKQKISDLRKQGKDVLMMDLQLMSVPLKIKVLEVNFTKKEFNKTVDMIEKAEKEINKL